MTVWGIVMDYKGNKKLVPLAKNLRKNMTREEKRLWYDFLRNHPARFRRQKILGKYILDFYSASAHLAIEIDGEHHYQPDFLNDDMKRTEYLNSYGVFVLRFSNREVRTNFDGVCQWINETISRNQSGVINNSPIDRE